MAPLAMSAISSNISVGSKSGLVDAGQLVLKSREYLRKYMQD